MCFASSSENTGLFPQPAEPPRHVLRPAQPQTPNGKRALETPAATAMHLRQTPLHGDCFTLRNLRRAVGAVFISPAFQRGVSVPQNFPRVPEGRRPKPPKTRISHRNADLAGLTPIWGNFRIGDNSPATRIASRQPSHRVVIQRSAATKDLQLLLRP